MLSVVSINGFTLVISIINHIHESFMHLNWNEILDGVYTTVTGSKFCRNMYVNLRSVI